MRNYWIGAVAVLMIVLAACTPVIPQQSQTEETDRTEPTRSSAASASEPFSTDPPSEPAASLPTPTAQPAGDAEVSPADLPPRFAQQEFSTDFSKHSVPYTEILSGGPPKDGIPAIDNPKFIEIAEAEEWLEPQEPVILVEINGDARAYPIQILIWHEIVNDVVGDVPVVVTFCPLCNTAIAFERTLDGQVLDFGTTGRLRFSNLIMYDRQTETWWQQAGGDAIAGEHTGRQLKFIPASIISWEDFKTNHPDGKVLSRDTGFSRAYGRNPYAGYDDVRQSPFLYIGPETPDQLLPMARVLTVDLNGDAVAYPYDVLQEIHVVNDEVGGAPIAVFWSPGTASALDSDTVALGRDVGTANSFTRVLDGETLTFQFDGEKIVDEQTGSVWNIVGRAIEGPLAGAELEPVVSINHFWFSWAAFRPDTRVYEPPPTS